MQIAVISSLETVGEQDNCRLLGNHTVVKVLDGSYPISTPSSEIEVDKSRHYGGIGAEAMRSERPVSEKTLQLLPVAHSDHIEGGKGKFQPRKNMMRLVIHEKHVGL